MYPSISQYIEAVNVSHGLFRSLTDVVFMRDDNGELSFCSGAEAVIFKVKHKGRCWAMKLYTSLRRNRGRYYECMNNYFMLNHTTVVPEFIYLENEIIVYIGDGDFVEFPVLLVEWIEGDTLALRLKRFAHLGKTDDIREMTNGFISFCSNMLECDFAHIDFKPENIIVDNVDRFHLIDIDALYIPGYDIDVPEEQGTFWFSHPNRREYSNGKFLSDYPIVIIVASMLILEREPFLLEKFTNGENLLFNPEDLINSKDAVYNYACNRFSDDPVLVLFLELLKSETPRIASLAKVLNISKFIRNIRPKENVKENDLLCFDDYTPFFEDVASVKLKNKWAFINRTGEILGGFVYDKTGQFSEGVAAACINGEWRLYDKNILPIISFENVERVGIMKMGLINVRKNGLWGYYDLQGRIVIEHKYDFARPFKSNGYADVRENGENYSIKR